MLVSIKKILGSMAFIGFLACLGVAEAQSCPDWSGTNQMISRSSDDLYSADRFEIVSGGSVYLTACSSVPGVGHVAETADLTLDFTNRSGHQLTFRVESSCDTTLLINTPDTDWIFDDDGGDNVSPYVAINKAPSGVYDIWVGSFEDDYCSSTLIIETF